MFDGVFQKLLRENTCYSKNKYILVGGSVFLWIAFFDSHNLVKQVKLKSEMKELEDKRDFYKTEIRNDSIALHELTTNPETQEKFAREKYFMKKKKMRM